MERYDERAEIRCHRPRDPDLYQKWPRRLCDIGIHVGLSVSAVNERLKKLQNGGAIRHYGAILEPSAIGLDVLAYVSVLIDWSVHNDAFLEAVMDMPEVLECHHVTGDHPTW